MSFLKTKRLTIDISKWIVLAIPVGILAGLSSWAFLESLNRVTSFRVSHGSIIYFLPIVGFIVVFFFHHLGGRTKEGSGLLIEEIHTPTQWIPKRMAPFVFIGTVVTHLFGGSVGREGAAIQMSGSLTDAYLRTFHIKKQTRQILLITALGGGFSAVFGVPFAGAIFALEVHGYKKMRYAAFLPALCAAFIGNRVVEMLGYHHDVKPHINANLDFAMILKIAIVGIAFGLTATFFVEGTHFLKEKLKKLIPYTPLHGLLGGAATLGLVALFGRDYLGLSIPLIDKAIAGGNISIWIPILKLIFTVIALGCSFPGGEVTPLFVIGATLGAALATPLGLPVVLLASMGFIAVFAGAVKTPLACIVMGAEIFGMGIAMPLALVCILSSLCARHRGLYVRKS